MVWNKSFQKGFILIGIIKEKRVKYAVKKTIVDVLATFKQKAFLASQRRVARL